MIIQRLELCNFRNYEKLNIDLDEKTNILYGKNAQGKTNLLEAAYFSSTTKSHKQAKDKDLIKIGENESHVKAFVKKDDREYEIDIHLINGQKKKLALNHIPQKKAVDIFGIIKAIFFSPEDLDIVKRGPEVRRRFLDMELCQIDKIYLNDLILYKRILLQRNKLLKEYLINSNIDELLQVWNEKLIIYGKRIIKKRKEFINEIEPVFKSNYKKISNNSEQIEIEYIPNTDENNFEKNLNEKKKEEIRHGQTKVGPHKDDIRFKIKGLDVRTYGSQGQQRSCALSLKLSEIEIMERITGEKPILLLDDVLSELDTDRQKKLLNSLYDVQTIITCTGIEEIKEAGLKIGKVFIVDNAIVKEI